MIYRDSKVASSHAEICESFANEFFYEVLYGSEKFMPGLKKSVSELDRQLKGHGGSLKST